MIIKELIKILQDMDSSKTIGVSNVVADSGVIIIKHTVCIMDSADINEDWHIVDVGKTNNEDCDYLIN